MDERQPTQRRTLRRDISFGCRFKQRKGVVRAPLDGRSRLRWSRSSRGTPHSSSAWRSDANAIIPSLARKRPAASFFPERGGCNTIRLIEPVLSASQQPSSSSTLLDGTFGSRHDSAHFGTWVWRLDAIAATGLSVRKDVVSGIGTLPLTTLVLAAPALVPAERS